MIPQALEAGAAAHTRGEDAATVAGAVLAAEPARTEHVEAAPLDGASTRRWCARTRLDRQRRPGRRSSTDEQARDQREAPAHGVWEMGARA